MLSVNPLHYCVGVVQGRSYLVPQAGIEPTTSALGVPCSVLLSYWGLLGDYSIPVCLRQEDYSSFGGAVGP